MLVNAFNLFVSPMADHKITPVDCGWILSELPTMQSDFHYFDFQSRVLVCLMV